MKKTFKPFLTAAIAAMVLASCNNKPLPAPPCLPAFVHTGFSDSLAGVNHKITLSEAKDLIKRFNDYKKQVQTGAVKDSFKTIPSYGHFNRDAIYSLINQPGVVGITIYTGMKANKTIVPVIVGVRSNGKPSIAAIIETIKLPTIAGDPESPDFSPVDVSPNSLDSTLITE